MKKSKKFLSVLCAVCMIMAVSASAFAANTPPALSPNAGKTIDVQSIIVRSDGTTEERITAVTIPENATVEVEDELTSDAARAALGLSGLTRAARGADPDQDLGSGTVGIYKADDGSQSITSIGTGTLDQDCEYLEVKFTSVDSGIKKINVRLENHYWTSASPNLNCYEKYSVISNKHTCTAIFYEAQEYPTEGTHAGEATCRLWSGDKIDVYASVNEGTAGNVTYSTGAYFS